MKRIITNLIVDPNKRQAFKGTSLKFLQDGFVDVVASVVEGLLNGQTGLTPVALWGCVKTANITHPANWDISEGYIFYDRTIYHSLAVIDLPTPTGLVGYIDNLPDAFADPTIFTDGSSANVHLTYYFNYRDGSPGSGDFDFSSMVYLNPAISPTLKHVKINTGKWNMQAAGGGVTGITVAHCLSNVVGVSAAVTDDGHNYYMDLVSGNTVTTPNRQGIIYWDGTNIHLQRLTGGTFDSPSFADAVMNRGYIIIHYIG